MFKVFTEQVNAFKIPLNLLIRIRVTFCKSIVWLPSNSHVITFISPNRRMTDLISLWIVIPCNAHTILKFIYYWFKNPWYEKKANPICISSQTGVIISDLFLWKIVQYWQALNFWTGEQIHQSNTEIIPFLCNVKFAFTSEKIICHLKKFLWKSLNCIQILI